MTTRTITQQEFEALRPLNNDQIVKERDGEFAYETIVDADGNEIAFASYRAGECVGYVLVVKE